MTEGATFELVLEGIFGQVEMGLTSRDGIWKKIKADC